jgi:hypothetical protein
VNGSPSPTPRPNGARRSRRGPALSRTPAPTETAEAAPAAGTDPVAGPQVQQEDRAADAPAGPAGDLADTAPDLIAAAVLAVPHVVALSGGRVGEIATYLPGRRVEGVRMRREHVEVHVVARYGPTMAEVGAAVHAAVVGAVGPTQVIVGIDDLAVPPFPGDGATVVRPADLRAQQRGTL